MLWGYENVEECRIKLHRFILSPVTVIHLSRRRHLRAGDELERCEDEIADCPVESTPLLDSLAP